MTTKHCQHISHARYDKNKFFFCVCLSLNGRIFVSLKELGRVTSITFLLHFNAVLFSSFPSILHLSYALLNQIPFQYHHWLTHQAEFFLQFLMNNLIAVWTTSFLAIAPWDPMCAASGCCSLMWRWSSNKKWQVMLGPSSCFSHSPWVTCKPQLGTGWVF